MKGNQWPLVLFTVLTQWGVGLLLISGVIRFILADQLNDTQADLFAGTVALLVICLTLIGMMTSLLHLGSPRNAYRAVLNLGSSWLSAEILLVLIFLLAAIGYGVSLWSGSHLTRFSTIVFWIGSGLGLFLVFVMTNVYRLKTVPTWNSPTTVFSFFKTVFLLGPLAAIAILQVVQCVTLDNQLSNQTSSLTTIFSWVILSALLLLVLDMMTTLQKGVSKKLSRAIAETRKSLYLRLFLILAGLSLFSIPLFLDFSASASPATASLVLGTAFLFILISELIDRKLFYASFERAGL
ncbi:dimethyl sulfoxide reductase anchor subunit [bacterium]|nr:dimethyl sulfoxide reductase anchor subunit [bacterium]